MNTILYLTFFSFLFCSGAAFIAVLTFFLQLREMDRRYHTLVYLNIAICSISCALHFYYFYQLQPAFASGDVDGLATIIAQFPAWLRYLYWLVTTVMLIIMFPLLIGVERVGVGLVYRLGFADAGMIITGYIGESSILAAGSVTPVGIIFFIIACGFWLDMIVYIFLVLRRLPSNELIPAQRDALGYMYFVVIFGWTIYPLGYFYAVLFDNEIGVVLREFTFNVGDIVNKVMWGLLVVFAARAVSRMASRGHSGVPISAET